MFNITGEMRIKPAMRCYFIPTRMAIIKKTNNNLCWWRCRAINSLYIVGGNVKWCSYFGKHLDGPQMSNIELLEEPTILLLSIYPRSLRNPHKNLYANVHSNMFCEHLADLHPKFDLDLRLIMLRKHTHTQKTWKGLLLTHEAFWGEKSGFQAGLKWLERTGKEGWLGVCVVVKAKCWDEGFC